MRKIGLLVLLLQFWMPTAYAETMSWLSLGSKMPRNTIFEISGTDGPTARASARVTQSDALDHCQNFSPNNVEQCTSRLISEEKNRIYTATANCRAGVISSVYSRSYTIAGYWMGDWGNGRSRWKDSDGLSVALDNASDGLSISQQWEVLCPTARPNISLEHGSGPASGGVVGIEHNGSVMWHDENNGVIYYEKPKSSLSSVVESGTVLFRGDPWVFGTQFTTAGTAYTFKRGCAPAPYPVVGGFEPSGSPTEHDRLVLKGAAPIREKSGCRIIGYSEDSSNAVLVFELHYGDV